MWESYLSQTKDRYLGRRQVGCRCIAGKMNGSTGNMIQAMKQMAWDSIKTSKWKEI